MSVYLPQDEVRPGTLVRIDRFIPRDGARDHIATNDVGLILGYPGEKGAFSGFVIVVILSGPLASAKHQLNASYLTRLRK